MTDSAGNTGSPPKSNKHKRPWCVVYRKEAFAVLAANEHAIDKAVALAESQAERVYVCKCAPGHPCYLHNGHSVHPEATAPQPAVDEPKPWQLGYKSVAPKPISTRVICRLCTCEGVQGTVLCKEHLEGYAFASRTLSAKGQHAAVDVLIAAIQQPKKEEG